MRTDNVLLTLTVPLEYDALLKDFARQTDRTPEELASELLISNLDCLHVPGEIEEFLQTTVSHA